MRACANGSGWSRARLKSTAPTAAARTSWPGFRWRRDRMKRPRVLLADDHAMVTEGLKSLLSNEFELVDVVDNGRAMIASAKKHRPDVIVADISMPQLNGIDAMIRLRKEARGLHSTADLFHFAIKPGIVWI